MGEKKGEGCVYQRGRNVRFTNAFDVQVVGQALDGGDALSSIPLLNANVHFALVSRSFVGIVECICGECMSTKEALTTRKRRRNLS